ncbi:hypothetical protein [Clostridium sp.]|uniref:hypothetical protein n=1 Tax=Clostridium sp. TaxID=1506 RepID=UPI00262AC487|nr:hypothetical protein [Clostridium sp.]
MIKYFQGGYDEAKLYTKCSGQKIYPICPDCGRVKNKPMKINRIYLYHTISCSCGDGISYPNKLMFAILEQLKIDFQTEYSPDWIKPKRYDFYFKLSNKEYIIEADGGWHNKNNNLSGQTKEISQEIDSYKDKLAEENNIKVIRIDCDYKKTNDRFEYIKNNIINNSMLKKLFNLNNIDWLKCEEFTCSNLVKKTCEIKKNNPNMSTTQVGKVIKLSQSTVIKYLKQGTKFGWCRYDIKEEKSNVISRAGKQFSKSVEIFKNEISLGIFPSASELERQSETLFGIKLMKHSISDVCRLKHTHYKGFTFKYIKLKESEG